MFYILHLEFIFSKRGFIYISIFALLAWLLKGYPEWRRKKVALVSSAPQDDSILSTTTTTTNVQDTKATTKETSFSSLSSSSLSNIPSEKNPSLAHYILVTPFAALYIVGRAMLDTIRFSLYYVLWLCEKTLPHLDDWLFELVTVAIPKTMDIAASWWTERGKPACTRSYVYTRQHLVPGTVHGLEVFFVGSYHVLCAIHTAALAWMAAWRRFVDGHDWHQLATDLGGIAYTTCWVPAAWIVTRTIHLCQIAYGGICAMAVSIANDVQWVCTIAMPAVYNQVTSTRLAQVAYRGLVAAAEGARWGCVCVNDYLLAPTIGQLLTFLVRSIDSFILLLQQRTLHEKLTRLYRLVAPQGVWMFMDFATIVHDFLVGSCHVYNELIHPTYRLFMKHIMPRLTIAYKAAAANLAKWYNTRFYPAWLLIYPYLNVPLLWMYTNLTLPVYRHMYHTVTIMINYITQHLSAQLWNLCAKIAPMVTVYAESIYSFVQLWLLKQAPILSGFIQSSYEMVLHRCDWSALRQEIAITVSFMYDWISKQSNMVYASLERSLSSWAYEQQHSPIDTCGKQKMA